LLAACTNEGRDERPAQLSLVAQTYAPLVDTNSASPAARITLPVSGPTPTPSPEILYMGTPLPKVQYVETIPAIVTYPAWTNRPAAPAPSSASRYDVRYGTISLPKLEEIISQFPVRQLDAQEQPTGPQRPNPLTGKGQFLLVMGAKYQINPAYALAFAIKESSMGTTGIAPTTNNFFGIRYSANCPGKKEKLGADGINRAFCMYNTIEEGVEAWFWRIREYYINGGLGRGNLVTVDQIVPVYAPAADNNNVDLYISQVKARIDLWGAAGN
jgi:hypothetical protein